MNLPSILSILTPKGAGDLADKVGEAAVDVKDRFVKNVKEAVEKSPQSVFDAAGGGAPFMRKLSSVIFDGDGGGKGKKGKGKRKLDLDDDNDDVAKVRTGKEKPALESTLTVMAKDIGTIRENTDPKLVAENLAKTRGTLTRGAGDPFATAEMREDENAERQREAHEAGTAVRSTSGDSKLMMMLSGKLDGMKELLSKMTGSNKEGGGIFAGIAAALGGIVAFFKTKFLLSLGVFFAGWAGRIAAAVGGAITSALRGVAALLGRGVAAVGGAAAGAAAKIGGWAKSAWGGLKRLGGRAVDAGARAVRAGANVARAAGRQVVGIASKAGGWLSRGVLKRIPVVGAAMGLGYAAKRAFAGDWTGAGMELASGAASTIPGMGTAASVAIDAASMARDSKNANRQDDAPNRFAGVRGGFMGIDEGMRRPSAAAVPDAPGTSDINSLLAPARSPEANIQSAHEPITVKPPVASLSPITVSGKEQVGGYRDRLLVAVEGMYELMSKPLKGIYTRDADTTSLLDAIGQRPPAPAAPSRPREPSALRAAKPEQTPLPTERYVPNMSTSGESASMLTTTAGASFSGGPLPHVDGMKPDEVALIREAMAQGITDPAELDALRAQVKHESGNFRYKEEIWGNTPAQARYEGRRDLGNVQEGDGYRYRGRGFIQLTGRANYEALSKDSGIDFVNNPDLLSSSPEMAAKSAVWYWKNRVSPRVDDWSDINRVTRLVNGGTNGLADRQRYAREIAANPTDYSSIASSMTSVSPRLAGIAEDTAPLVAQEAIQTERQMAVASLAPITIQPPVPSPPARNISGGSGQGGVSAPLDVRNPDSPVREHARAMISGSV